MSKIPDLEGKIVTFYIAAFGDHAYGTAGTVLSENLNVKPGDKLEGLSVSFKIEKKVHITSKGSFGVVYNIISKGSRKFVVKAVQTDIEFSRWFFTEPMQLRQPDFVPIVPLLASGLIPFPDGQGFRAILMERADDTYPEKIRRADRSQWPLWMLRACESIIRACIFMRSRGIFNGDIRPPNLLVYGESVLLCDGSLANFASKYPNPEQMFQGDLRRAGTAILVNCMIKYDQPVSKDTYESYCDDLNEDEINFFHHLSVGKNLDATQCLTTVTALRSQREPPGSPQPPPLMLDYVDFWTKLIGTNPKPEGLRLDGSQIALNFPSMFQQPPPSPSQTQNHQNNIHRLIPDKYQHVSLVAPKVPARGHALPHRRVQTHDEDDEDTGDYGGSPNAFDHKYDRGAARRRDDDDHGNNLAKPSASGNHDDDEELDLSIGPSSSATPQVSDKAVSSSSQTARFKFKSIAKALKPTQFHGGAGAGNPMDRGLLRKVVASPSASSVAGVPKAAAAPRLDNPAGSPSATQSSNLTASPESIANRPRVQNPLPAPGRHKDHTYLGQRLSEHPKQYLIRKRRGAMSKQDCDELMLELLEMSSEQAVVERVNQINNPLNKNHCYKLFFNDTVLACWKAIRKHRTVCQLCQNN